MGDAARVSPSPPPRSKKSGGIQAYFLYGSDISDAARVSPSPPPRSKKSGGIQAYFLYGSDISAVRQQVAGVIEKKTFTSSAQV